MRSLLYLNLRDDCFYCQAIDTLLSSHQYLHCMGNYHCMPCSWGIISSKNKRNNHPRGLNRKADALKGHQKVACLVQKLGAKMLSSTN